MYDPLRRMIRPVFAIAILHMATASTLAVPGASPQIESLSTQSIDRSGRLLIFGTNFGATQGKSRVLIDGRVAIATTWTDTEIHAYVPEGASIDSVPVTVTTTVAPAAAPSCGSSSTGAGRSERFSGEATKDWRLSASRKSGLMKL